MSPRPYDQTLRKAAAEEACRRIVEAAAALHAEHGGLATSHAMIAERAGVSIPTVYKYFPTRNDLIPACTGLASSPPRPDRPLPRLHRARLGPGPPRPRRPDPRGPPADPGPGADAGPRALPTPRIL